MCFCTALGNDSVTTPTRCLALLYGLKTMVPDLSSGKALLFVSQIQRGLWLASLKESASQGDVLVINGAPPEYC
eukprot:1558153-Amphidinium_carterae.1